MSAIRIIAGSRVTRPESTLGQGMMDHAAERCGQIEGDIAKTVLSVLTADTLHLLVMFADTGCWARRSLHPQ